MIPVLHLRSGHGLYGADRALLALARATPAPFSPIVGALVRGGAPDALGGEARRLGLERARFASERPLDWACAREIATFVEANGVQLIHAHDFKSLAMAVVAERQGVPVVATFHGDVGGTLTLRAYEAVGRLLGNATAGVVAVSRPLERKLRRWVPAAPVSFIANGLAAPPRVTRDEREAARAQLGLDPGELMLACIGRLSPEKGHAVLIDALRALPRPPRVVVLGDGPLRAALQQHASGLPVQFLGYDPNPRALYAACDAVVMPSLTEGLPLVALEAALLERPMIASAVGELPEVLGDDAGVLVPPGDPRALAWALDRWVREPGALPRFAQRAASRVGHRYSAEAMASAYASGVYAPALERAPATAATSR